MKLHLLVATYDEDEYQRRILTEFTRQVSPSFSSVSAVTATASHYLGDTLDFTGYLPSKLAGSSQSGWVKRGLISWKLRLIYEHLTAHVPIGESVYYHDYNYIKYPAYLGNVGSESVAYLCQKLLRCDIILFDEGFKPLNLDVPSALIRQYQPLLPRFSFLCTGVWAGAMVIKHTNESREFLQQLISASQYSNMLTPLYAFDALEPGEYFSGEQSILSLLRLASSKLKSSYKIHLLHTRRRAVYSTALNQVYLSILFKASQLKFLSKTVIRRFFSP